MQTDAEYYRRLVRPTIAGRKLILFGQPLAGYTRFLTDLAEMGAERPFIIASGPGTGDPPKEEDAEWALLDVEAPDIITEIRATVAQLEALPAAVLDRLDAWDPDRSAIALGNPFYTAPTLAGRRVYGGRPPQWAALEDKMLADEIWDAADVRREPSTIVAADRDALLAAARRLDRGDGTVWSGDTKEGFNGGAVYVRWVRLADQVDDAAAFFEAHCDRVRVMPFLEGTPCSIHGIVFPTEVVALRPCELVTLRRAEGSTLAYSGSGCHWTPAPGDVAAMRGVARRVGEHLRHRANYRGAFTVDGVMTEHGFRPTELNSRAGAAIGHVTGAVEGLPLGGLQRALTEAEPFDYRPEEFEELVMTASEAKRRSIGRQSVTTRIPATESVELRTLPDGRLAEATESGRQDAAAGTLSFGPGGVGGFVGFSPDDERLPIGPPVAPLVAEALRIADERWNIGIGELHPPVPVR